MESQLVVVCACAGAFLLWCAYRTFVRRSPLDILPGPPSTSLIFGNLPDVDYGHGIEQWQYLADTYGPVLKMNGVLGGPFLHIYDHNAMYSILVKDTDLFRKNLAPMDEFSLLFGPGILTAEGSTHRRQRKLLNPVFSVAHLRNMTRVFYDIANLLRGAIETCVGKDTVDVDMNNWMTRTTLEMLGQAGLGYSFGDSFKAESTNEFGDYLKMFFPVLESVPLIGTCTMALSYLFSEKGVRKVLCAFPSANLQKMLDISDFIFRRSREILLEQQVALEKGDLELAHRVEEGKDILSLLLKANVAASESEKATEAELVSQILIFVLAGMDTTSNALSRALQILAQHPEAQEKLRAEIIQARGGTGSAGTDIEHDDLIKLPYLDAVCRECLRLYAPAPLIIRRPIQDVVLPLAAPIHTKEGPKTEIHVPKGTTMFLNLQAVNRNKALWGEDVREWRPERWLEPLPNGVEDARIPGVYNNSMTFSGGPRGCIGFKFSQLEMKVILAVLIGSFKFELTEKPITWHSSIVLFPTMGTDSTKPEMVLKVTAV